MKRILKPILLIAPLLLFSCKKESVGVPLFNETCITTQHHEQVVGPINIYVQYNNPVFPGYRDLSLFDTVLTTDSQGRLCIPNLPEGKSWLVGMGRDNITQDSVKGSISIFVSHPRDSKDTIMYVSEVH